MRRNAKGKRISTDQPSGYELPNESIRSGQDGWSRRAEEIEALIPERYPEGSVVYNGSRKDKIDLYVYQDYQRQRGKLNNPLARKYVEPYSAYNMAMICPVVERVVVMAEE